MTAMLTRVRLFTTVNPLVDRQISLPSEGGSAPIDTTPIWALFRVGTCVCRQRGCGCEASFAPSNVTAVGTFIRVGSLVDVKIAFPGESLGALRPITRVGFGVRVLVFVDRKTVPMDTAVGTSGVVAYKTRGPVVCFAMRSEVPGSGTPIPTPRSVTLVRPDVCVNPCVPG